MSRALPLPDDAQGATITGTVAVYDPAMCCPTGVCGPGVDPALLQIIRDLRWLEGHGVSVYRFGLAHEPQRFAGNPRVTGLLQAFGESALPATLVNDVVLVHGRYPSRDELLAALAGRAGAGQPSDDATGVCRAPGSGCC